MKIRELVLEDVPFVPGQTAPQQPTPAGQAPRQTPGKEGQDVGKLTASISALQKQVADLQKAALQQSTQQASEKPAAQPAPGEAGQQQAPKGTIAPAAQQAPQQQQQPVAGQKPPLGQPQGVPMGQPAATPATPAKPAPGVSQPSSITNMKIKQAVAQNQSGGQ
jgi:hypothetical protein